MDFLTLGISGGAGVCGGVAARSHASGLEGEHRTFDENIISSNEGGPKAFSCFEDFED